MSLDRHELRHRDGRRLLIYGDLRGSLADEPTPAPESSSLHKRFDRLSATWIAVSPARNARPNAPSRAVPEASLGVEGETVGSSCPLCPGGPEVPFSYEAAVFENRFPSLVADPPAVPVDSRISPSQGRCEVVLYTERHDGSLASLSPRELARLVAIWRDRAAELWADARHRYVMLFENRGRLVGATISHPHGQIYAFDHVPPLIAARAETLARHRERTGRCLSCEVVADDLAEPERTIVASELFTVAVPFAARFPFEVHVRARRHGVGRLGDLDHRELSALAAALRAVVLHYDALFGFELPYMMVAQEAPPDSPDWHLAFEFLPTHRTEVLTKIRASVETATGLFINDTLPESSARQLQVAGVESRAEEPVPEVVHLVPTERAG
jgi:UDPglucose--hexose-1-phosphate uridylyltransferase